MGFGISASLSESPVRRFSSSIVAGAIRRLSMSEAHSAAMSPFVANAGQPREARTDGAEAKLTVGQIYFRAGHATGHPMTVLDAPRITPEIVAEHGLSAEEYDHVLH